MKTGRWMPTGLPAITNLSARSFSNHVTAILPMVIAFQRALMQSGRRDYRNNKWKAKFMFVASSAAKESLTWKTASPIHCVHRQQTSHWLLSIHLLYSKGCANLNRKVWKFVWQGLMGEYAHRKVGMRMVTSLKGGYIYKGRIKVRNFSSKMAEPTGGGRISFTGCALSFTQHHFSVLAYRSYNTRIMLAYHSYRWWNLVGRMKGNIHFENQSF